MNKRKKYYQKLKEKFNNLMDTYAKILCERFGYNFEDCFWTGDDRSDCFALSDSGYFITMSDVIIIVENDIDYKTFTEYDYYNKCIHYAHLNHPNDKGFHNINLISWISNCPKQYSEEELRAEENLYWENLKTIIE